MGLVKNWAAGLAVLCALVGLAPAQSHAVAVDAEILLMIDVSGSVDESEFLGQRSGYRDAFQSQAVKDAIEAATGGIAVSVVQWSQGQVQSINWTHLDSAADSNTFGDTIGGMARAGGVGTATALGDALNFGATLFAGNGFEGLRQIIDISGDGATNTGISSSSGRSNALAAGVDVINGIAILGAFGLLAHYENEVIGGTNADGSPAFVIGVENFTGQFADAMQRKLVAEITGTGIPEPMSLVLFGAGLLGLGVYRLRRAA